MRVLLPTCLRVLCQPCERGSQVTQTSGVGVNEKLIAVFRQLEGKKMVWHTVWLKIVLHPHGAV